MDDTFCMNKGSVIFMCCNFHCRIWDGDNGIVASVHWLVKWDTSIFDVDMVTFSLDMGN